MEFKARYELMGAFTLIVIIAAFGFIYWLNNMAGFGDQAHYRIRFETPTSGLQVGGRVLFNGLRVGEVTKLQLNPEEPRFITATIAVDKETPVRADTIAGIEYQGLTGIAGIQLVGGSSSALPLPLDIDKPPLLVADPKAGNDWAGGASQVLAQLNTMLKDNEKPLSDIMSNVATFSKALGGNKERVDNILKGIERMTGGSAGGGDEKRIFDLAVPDDFPPLLDPVNWRLVVAEPSVLLALNTDRIQQRPGGGETKAFSNARWSDNLPNLLQEKVIQSFENAGYTNAVLRPLNGLESDTKLALSIRGFHLASDSEPQAHIAFIARLIDGNGKVMASKSFKASVPVKDKKEKPVAHALGQAFSTTMLALIAWTAVNM